MKSLSIHIHGKLIGQGSTGSVYDLGNGRICKYIDDGNAEEPVHPNIKKKDIDAINRWSEISHGLKAIPYIYNWNGESYEMDKLQVPCLEGRWIDRALNKCLFSEWPDDWTPKQIQKAKDLLGEKRAEWVMSWLKDFAHDYDLIMGNPHRKSPDTRLMNIGKDKKGNVVYFDWFDPYCA